MDEVYRHLDTHVLFKLHWGGRGVKGEAWRQLVSEDFRPDWSGCGASRLPPPAGAARLLPVLRGTATSIVVLDPEDPSAERDASSEPRFVCPRQPKGDRICLADFFRPLRPAPRVEAAEELDVIAVQAVTVGSR